MGTPTKAKSTKNTKFQRGDGGVSEVFTTIGEVTSFSAPGREQGEIVVTNFDSDSVEVIGDGLADGGTITLPMNFVGSDAQQQGLRADCDSGVTRNFKLIINDHLSNPTTFTFPAIVKKVDGPKGGVGEAYKMEATLRVAGKPTTTYSP